MTVVEQHLEEPQPKVKASRRVSIPAISVVILALAALAVGVAVAGGPGGKARQLSANTEPYVLEQAAAFPNGETFTVTAFRQAGVDCVQARSSITTTACNQGTYDSVASGSAPGLFAAIGNGAQYLWYGAVSPDIKEFVLESRSGESRVIKPVPPTTAGTSLPVIAIHVPDAQELVSTTAVRSDGTRVDIKDFFGPNSAP